MAKKRRTRGIDRRILILFSVMPIGCLFAIFAGLAVAWFIAPTSFVNAPVSELSEVYADEVVIMAAADYAEYQDIARANEILAQLNVPNTAQYVSLVAERLIRINRESVTEEIENVVNLADALGVSTVSMIAYVAPPTATFTPVPPTPTHTAVVLSQIEEADTAVEASVQEVATTEESTETPIPTDTPVPPTDTPVPGPDTPVPQPPTNTPEPEPTPEPESPLTGAETDFVIVKQRLLTIDENGGCMGNHNIFVEVIDAAGNPIKGVQLGDIWDNPGPATGHKGDDKPGRAEYDLYKDSGYHILVTADPTAGREVTSEATELLSSDDWKIGIPRLIEAGYCPDEGTCRTLWNSGVFGEGNNSLCWGHYSWEVVFQRIW